MKISIIIIFDVFREKKINRLLLSLKSEIQSLDCEVLLVQESNKPFNLPPMPIKVRHIPIEEKGGISFNRNQGIKHAKGEIIVFIDDDCWVRKGWLKSLINPLASNQEILAATSGTKIPSSNFLGNCISALGFPGGGSLGFEKVWRVSNGFTNHLTVGNCALRRTIFIQTGLFDETMKSGAEDAEFSFRLEKLKIPIKYVPEAFAFHEPRTKMKEFVRWQLRRGRANYQFKKKVGKINTFVKLRLWSAKNIVKENILNPGLPVILFLLCLSFSLQQLGFLREKFRNRRDVK